MRAHTTISLVICFAIGLMTSALYGQGSQNQVSLQNFLESFAKKYDLSLVYDSEEVTNIEISIAPMGQSSPENYLSQTLNKYGFLAKNISDKSFIISKAKIEKSTRVSASQIVPIEKVNLSGTVTDQELGDPLIGVNILELGTQNGTTSDEMGRFSLEVTQGAKVVFSYIGYLSQEIKINKEQDLSVSMVTDANTMEEVVIVGYGSQKRSDLTGATSSIRTKDIKQLPSTGLDQAIQGRAAGVQVTQNSGSPGGGVSIRIRGIGSTLSAEPLYVIDGIPVVNDNQGTSSNFAELDGGGQNPNALNTINPNDIENIEILKDASATAIYGARAANGVVLITTKRGQSGRSSISFENYVGIQELSKKVQVLNLQEYADYFKSVTFDQIEEFDRPELLGEGTDWQDAIFRRAYLQNHQLTVSGGSDRTQFAFSGGYHFKQGIVEGSDFTRLSAKINIDHKVSDKFRIGNSFLVSRTNENITFNSNSNGVIYTALLMVPNAPVRNSDGSFAGPQEEITLPFDNPLARALETSDVNRKTRVLANVYAELDIFPWLKYRTEFGTDIVYSNHNTFFPSFERGNFFGRSGVRRTLNNNLFWINKHLLTFDKQLGEKHHLTTLFGFEAQKGTYEWLFASRDNLPTNELTELSLGDAGTQQVNGGAGHWSLLSGFSRVNYSMADKYLLTATIRADGSSRFGPNNRYGYFPSAAFAWRISEENFVKSLDFVDNLKLRIGVGAVGNQEIGFYSYSANLRSINVVLGDQLLSAFGPDNIANPDVRWESSFQTNFGLDMGFFNNKLEFILDYYIKLADGMLLPALIPSTAGSLNPPFVNIGEIENRGLEMTLNYTINRKNILWRNGVNFSINRNKVLDLGDNGNLIGIIQRIPVTRTEEGRPISQFYGYVMEGIFRDLADISESAFQSDGTRPGDIKFEDLNQDGIINEEDQTFLGSPLPDFTANWTSGLEYKGLDFSFFFQGVFGNEILNIMRRDIEGMAGLSNQSIAVLDRYTSTNTEGTLPRPTSSDPNGNRRVSSRYIEDGTFVRLKNLSLGYNFKSSLIQKLKLSSLRIYLSGQNIFTWSNYSGYDPEVGSYNQSPLINGVENGRYPISRSMTFGLNATF